MAVDEKAGADVGAGLETGKVITLDATVAGADANSYVTLEEAEAYFDGRLNASAWIGTSKVQALLTACRHIEACRIRVHRRPYGYPSGLAVDVLEPVNADQALKFPRQRDRSTIGTAIIPQPVKDAQCEEALALLAAGSDYSRRQALQAQGVTSFSVDGLSETYAQERAKAASASSPLQSPEAAVLLAPYIDKGGVIATSDSPDGEWTPGSQGP